tara:strand:- start:818 stop:1519 length:702 start_codon:yes stop_codon:yes gene_type:complete
MIKLVDILTEGVYDPGIFKVVFTAGGPGSGKSYAASTLFGMPEKMPMVSANGLKGVNSDSAFEAYMKKAKMPLDLEKLTNDQHADAMSLRGKAKSVTAKRMQSFINSRLGMLIDGTGKNYSKIAKMKKMLQEQGYDCYMVFVNTDLKVALERNAARERTVPIDLVKKSWQEVNQNLGKFQALFGSSNILVVDNSEYKEFANIVKAKAREFVSRPIQNYIAKKWIKKELEIKKS